MKLKQYIEHLTLIANEHPDIEVVYAADDEGNYYNSVHFTPCVGHFENGEWTSTDNFDDHYDDTGDKLEVNAVCIN